MNELWMDWRFGPNERLGLIQLTMVLVIGWVLGRLFLVRTPQTTAWHAIVSLTVALGIALFVAGELPRPWELSLERQQPLSKEDVGQSELANGSRLLGVDDANLTVDSELPALLSWAITPRKFLASWINGSSGRTSRWSSWLAYAFLLLMVVVLLRLIAGTYLILQLKRRSKSLHRSEMPAVILNFLEKRDPRQRVLIRISDFIEGPCVHWLDRNSIYLPHSCSQWTSEEQLAVLAHEFAHVRRHDAVLRLLYDLMATLLSFHPMVYLLRRQLVAAQELATDRHAISLLDICGRQQAELIEQYRRGLVQFALRLDRQAYRRGLLEHYAVGLLGFSHGLIRRIEMLQGSCEMKRIHRRLLSVGSLFCLAAAGLALGAWQVTADEPVRVAARPDAVSTAPRGDIFARASHAPWSQLGKANGYLVVDAEALQQHPLASMLLTQLNVAPLGGILKSDAEGRPQSLQAVGLDFAKVQRIAGALTVTVTADSTAAEGAQNSVSLGSNAFRVETRDAIDWEHVLSQINIEAWGLGDSREGLEQAIRELPHANVLELGANELGREGSEQLQQLFDGVSGGVVTAILLVPENLLASINRQGVDQPVELAMLELVEKLSGLGVGIDYQSGSPVVNVRVVMQAKGNQTESDSLAQSGEQARQEILTLLAAKSDSVSQMLHRSLTQSTTESRFSKDGQHVTLEWNFQFDPMLLMVAQMGR
jgi:beta-lactamase regulating signal transducer with metallopeptidase domain